MKHLGDITKIKGYEVPAVDIICGGSPCQDLSTAGKRAGLNGERSGLFMEQVRIIKEMRDESRRGLSIRRTDYDRRDIMPRFEVWENVTGALSSNGGEDFRIVLEETAKICDPNASIPKLENGHKWTPSGCVLGDGWSIAWRVHNSEFWGIPQRRKRVCLIADFGGESAPKILFERKGSENDVGEIEAQRQEASSDIRKCSSVPNRAFTIKMRGGREIDSKGHKAGKGALIQVEKAGTIGVSQDQTLIQFSSCFRKQAHPRNKEEGQGWEETSISDTLNTNDFTDGHTPNVIVTTEPNYSVIRRFTPKEAERLMGFPDDWTNIGDWIDSKGKTHKLSDSPRFKALGNSLCLPFWQWMAERMCNILRSEGNQDITMASLFDGIGGFPLVYSRCGCNPVWASEIEEFPIAVTKYHFGEE